MLNNEHFTLLAGNPQKWDEETQRRCRPGAVPGTWQSEDLCAVQRDQRARGRRGALLCETVFGWSVRAGSGLDNFMILYASSQKPRPLRTRAAAIAWGTAWANEDPDKREFYAYKRELEKPDKFAGLANETTDDRKGG